MTITIDSAIRRLGDLFEEHHSHLSFDNLDALAMGIEALEEVKYYRANSQSYVLKLLSGETEEKEKP